MAQLVVTYLAEASIPFFVLGLNGLQQPQGGWASLAGALMYGFAFVGLSATVLYPIVTGVRDADVVFEAFGALYDLNAGLALVGGLVFGVSVLRARVFPPWTGVALVAGLLVTAGLTVAGLPEEVQTVGHGHPQPRLRGDGRRVSQDEVNPHAGPLRPRRLTPWRRPYGDEGPVVIATM